MPAKAFVIRFPDGDFEYDMRRAVAPRVGETIRKKGLLWKVMRVTRDEPVIVHVARTDAPKSK
jgi:hypothetical protein